MNVGVPPDIAAQLSGFTGREWAFSRLDGWCQSDGVGLLVVGGPGSGKSWLVAELIRRRGDKGASKTSAALGGWHFCRSTNDSTLLPQYVISGLATQLSSLPGYLDALGTIEPVLSATIKSNVTVYGDVAPGSQVIAAQITLIDASVERQFDRVVRAPLSVLAQQGRLPNRLVLAVDGLDEALILPDGELLVALLSRLLASKDSLPSGVKLLLTGRPDRRLLARLSAEQLHLDDAASTSDIQAYARRRLSGRLPLAGAERIAEQVAAASHTSFLYARYVLDDLLADPSNPIALPDRLPEGLSGYYAASLDRELAVRAERWEDRYRPLLGALAVARSGLTAGQLCAITKLTRSVVDDALKRCSPYLVGRSSEPIHFFHQSFADYLLEEGQHTIYPDEAHMSIASYLAGASETDQIDLVWHLAKAGDLQGLDLALGRARLARRELLFGSASVVDDLVNAADGAAAADDVIRTLRWSWAAAERRRHGVEATNRQLLALFARLGHINEALRGASLLDPSVLEYSEVITELAVQLVSLGRVDEALGLVARARLPYGTASALAAVAAQIAATDPCRALQLTIDHEIAATPQLCAALAAAGGGFLLAAEELAGTDPSALEAVVKTVGRHDIERAVEISTRIKHRYEPAAGSKQYRGPGMPLSELIAELACSDPLAARKLLDRFLTSNRLQGQDARFAIASTALALSAVNGAEVLDLLQYVEDNDYRWTVTKGLVLAAAAASETPAHRRAAFDQWHRWPQRSMHWFHESNVDLLDRLDLTRLGATSESRTIAGELFAHLIQQLVNGEADFEYPASGVGALASAVAAVDPGSAVDVLNRVLRDGHVGHAEEAKMRLAIGLARVDRGRAFDVALSAGIHSHRALVNLVGVLAATSLDDALEVIDRVDTRYTGTRAELIGAVVAHVPINDLDALERLQTRLPQRGASEAFLIPYALAGMSLAAAAVDHDQSLVRALIDRCRGGIAYDQRVRDPLTVAEAVQLAADDAAGALDRVSTVRSPAARISGTIKVLRRGRYDDAAVCASITRVIDGAGSVGIGKRTELDLIDLTLDLAGRDFDRAFDLAITLLHRLFRRLAPRLTSLAINQFGASPGVQRVVSGVLAAPTPGITLRKWALHHRLVALFDAQPPTIDEHLLADLERRGEWDLRWSLEPWALTPSDPSGAYALLVARDLLGVAEGPVIVRAARRDLETALTLSAASAANFSILENAVAVAASLDPHRCHAVIVDFNWADEWARSRAYCAAVEPAAQHDPSLALDLVKRITDESLRIIALKQLACAPIVAADPMHAEWGVLPLIAIADTLPVERRSEVLKTITAELLVGHPPCEVICRCLSMAAKRDTQAYEICLPHLLVAAYSTSVASGKQLLDEFDAVAELIRA